MKLHFKIILLLLLMFVLQLGMVENLGGGGSQINLFLITCLFLVFFSQSIHSFLPYVLICGLWDGILGTWPWLGYIVIVYLAIFVLIYGLKRGMFRKETGGVFVGLALTGFVTYYLASFLSFYLGSNHLSLSTILDENTFFFFLYNGLICIALGYGNFFSRLTREN